MQTPGDIFETVTLRRYGAGSWSGGRWTSGSYTTVTITGSVQPGGMKELMTLEEGDRTKDMIAIWTQSPLYTENETIGTAADRIVWDGSLWQVRRVESHGKTPELHHYHAVAVREQKA